MKYVLKMWTICGKMLYTLIIFLKYCLEVVFFSILVKFLHFLKLTVCFYETSCTSWAGSYIFIGILCFHNYRDMRVSKVGELAFFLFYPSSAFDDVEEKRHTHMRIAFPTLWQQYKLVRLKRCTSYTVYG